MVICPFAELFDMVWDGDMPSCWVLPFIIAICPDVASHVIFVFMIICSHYNCGMMIYPGVGGDFMQAFVKMICPGVWSHFDCVTTTCSYFGSDFHRCIDDVRDASLVGVIILWCYFIGHLLLLVSTKSWVTNILLLEQKSNV